MVNSKIALNRRIRSRASAEAALVATRYYLTGVPHLVGFLIIYIVPHCRRIRSTLEGLLYEHVKKLPRVEEKTDCDLPVNNTARIVETFLIVVQKYRDPISLVEGTYFIAGGRLSPYIIDVLRIEELNILWIIRARGRRGIQGVPISTLGHVRLLDHLQSHRSSISQRISW